MTLNEILIAALEPTGLPVKPNTYNGECKSYLTFNYDELPTGYGDDDANQCKYLVQVHLFLPVKAESTKVRGEVRRLIRTRFSRPGVIDACTEEYQHFVFEFETLEGDDGEV